MARGRMEAARELQATVGRYEAPLLRCAMRIVGDAELARDIVQDTFARFWERQEDHAALQRVDAWLFTVCRNRALDVLRRERRLRPLEEVSADSPNGDLAPERRHDLEAILRMIEQLPRRQQTVLELRFKAGCSYREISERTGLSVTHVGQLLHVAIRALRREVDVTEGENP